jgi:hypothetical protein
MNIKLTYFIKDINNLLRYLHTAFNINYGYCLMICGIIKTELEKKGIKSVIVKTKGRDNAIHYICCINGNYKYRINEYPFNDYLPVEKLNIDLKEVNNIYKMGHWSLKYENKYTKCIKSIIINFIKNYRL